MFFPERITSIRPQDKVLEIGPGSTPHARSDAFLELKFSSKEEKVSQRGAVDYDADFGNRPISFYDGGRFPFQDNEFDYVICSHVIEHVNDPESFLLEVFRVGKGRGYLEYPLITYEYLYNYDVHLHFVKFDNEQNVMRYLPKKNTSIDDFSVINALFRRTLENGWSDLCVANKNLFFEGFEFNQAFKVECVHELKLLLPPLTIITKKKALRRYLDRIKEKFDL